LKEQLLILAAISTCVLSMAWLPSISKKVKISYPIFLLLMGFGLYWLEIPITWPDHNSHNSEIMLLSEIIVVVSLMTAGLKIDISYARKNWKVPFRLIAIAMPLTMISIFFIGINLLSLSIPLAVLLAAVMAPTDPVLASEVQLKETYLDKDKDRRNLPEFTLTSEAGINDGLAFPFTYLGALLIKNNGIENFDWLNWFLDKFLLKIVIGIVAGFLMGWIIIKLQKYLKELFGIKTWDGLLAFSLAIATYSLTELIHGYGFLAVFITSLTLRNSYRIDNQYKKKLHSFIDEIERLLLVLWVVLFAGTIMSGFLSGLSWQTIAIAIGIVIILRPLCGLIALTGTRMSRKERFTISFFGVRGIGSLFYLSWAFVYLNDTSGSNELYTIVTLIVFCSIIIHGISAPFFFRKKLSDN